jgi:hypothetical protein
MLAYNETNPAFKKFVAAITHPIKMRLFLFAKLPSAWFMGVRVKKMTADAAEVSVNMGWRSQNPFQSIYFAAQAAAAEMSTGLLAMAGIQGRGSISMLVSNIEGEFLKKATTKTVFTCNSGAKIYEAIQKAIDTGEGQTIRVETIGIQKTGEVVSKFYITWSFKAKK